MSRNVEALTEGLIIGDSAAGNYLTIGTDGGVVFSGNGRRWEDLRTFPISATHTGPRAPELVTVVNDGSSTVGYAVDMSNTHIDIPFYSEMNTQTMTINLWINPDSVNNIELIDRDASGYFELYVANGSLDFKVGGHTVSTGNGVVVAGQTQMITAVANNEGANTRIKLYVNGNLQKEQVVNSTLPTSNTTDGYIVGQYYNGGWQYDGKMDGLYIYNVALTDSQIIELYNSGEGTTSHPTGIDEVTEVIAKIDFNEGSGSVSDNDCTLGAGYDATWTSGVTWVDGLMGVTSGSVGVKVLRFPANRVTEIYGSIQLPHSWVEGSTIYGHPHWAAQDTTVGDIYWKFEYLWINIGESMNVNTTIIGRTITNDTELLGKHRMNHIPSEGIDGSGKLISSILQYRFYRDGVDALDTYDGDVYLSELDFHILLNTIGSTNTMSK